MTTPLEKIAEEKNGNYQSSQKGGRSQERKRLYKTPKIPFENEIGGSREMFPLLLM